MEEEESSEAPIVREKVGPQTRAKASGRLYHPSNLTKYATSSLWLITLIHVSQVCSYCGDTEVNHAGKMNKCKEKECPNHFNDLCIGKYFGTDVRRRCINHIYCDAHNSFECDKCPDLVTTWREAARKSDPAELSAHPRDPEFARECREARQERMDGIAAARAEASSSGQSGPTGSSNQDFVGYVRLTNTENKNPFDQEECETSLQIALNNMDVRWDNDDSRPFTVLCHSGKMGPYTVVVTNKDAFDALLGAEEVDIFNTSEDATYGGTELAESTFAVEQLDELGRPMARMAKKAAEALEKQVEREARALERADYRDQDKARTLLIFADLPLAYVAMATGTGDQGIRRMMKITEDAATTIIKATGAQKMNVIPKMNKHNRITGEARIFLEWQMGKKAVEGDPG